MTAMRLFVRLRAGRLVLSAAGTQSLLAGPRQIAAVSAPIGPMAATRASPTTYPHTRLIRTMAQILPIVFLRPLLDSRFHPWLSTLINPLLSTRPHLSRPTRH